MKVVRILAILFVCLAEDGSCTVHSGSQNVVVSGSGKFVSKGEKNSLGGKDRNAIYLDYTVNLTDNNIQLATKDTLVLRTRKCMVASHSK